MIWSHPVEGSWSLISRTRLPSSVLSRYLSRSLKTMRGKKPVSVELTHSRRGCQGSKGIATSDKNWGRNLVLRLGNRT